MIDWLAGFSAAEITRPSTQKRMYANASNSTASAAQKTPETCTYPVIDIAAHVENFMWRQMCIIKQQTQALEAEAISAETDDIGTCYIKLSRSYAALLPIRPLLDGLIAVLLTRGLPVDHFRQQLSSVDEALENIKSQMYNLNYEHNDIRFVRSAQDPDTEKHVATMQQDAEGFVHVQLDRQQAAEDLMEVEDELETLQAKLNTLGNRPVGFSAQLQTQIATLELHVNRLLEERAAMTIPTPPKEPEEPALTISMSPVESEERSATTVPTSLGETDERSTTSTSPMEPEERSTTSTSPIEPEERFTLYSPPMEPEEPKTTVPTPPVNILQMQEQETHVEGLQLTIDPPAHSTGVDRNIEPRSLLFSTNGDYMRRRDFSDDPPIIDLTWTSPAPSPRRVVSALNNPRGCY
jgi:hypothetical protein